MPTRYRFALPISLHVACSGQKELEYRISVETIAPLRKFRRCLLQFFLAIPLGAPAQELKPRFVPARGEEKC